MEGSGSRGAARATDPRISCLSRFCKGDVCGFRGLVQIVRFIRLALGYAANPLAAFIAGPILARVLGPEARGELAAATSAVILVTVIFATGLPDSLALTSAKQGTRLTSFLARHRWRIAMASALASGAALLLGATLFGDQPSASSVMVAGALALPLLITIEIARGYSVGTGTFARIQAESYVSNFGRLACIAVLAAAGALTALSAGIVTLVLMLLGGCFLFLRRGRFTLPTRDLVTHSGHGARPEAKDERRVALRYWAGTVATQANARLSQVLILPLSGAAQVGYFAVALSLMQVLSLMAYSLRVFLFRNAARDATGALVARATRLMLPSVILAVGVMELVAEPAIHLLFGPSFNEAIPILRFLLVAVVPMIAAGILGAGLSGAGKQGTFALGEWVAFGVGTLCLVLLAPAHGGVGAALAVLATYITSCGWSLIALSRATGTPLRAFFWVRRSDIQWLMHQLKRRN
ncbi:lipopolysaccharide biosynthesis protein [Salinibacterium sp. ZJ450]|uniref:lipopolysaccharide biosynthesis protein n=1 Tax=Salinibacterium sp. ZJ450 TaxID=2708338 RepID=UPI00351D8928